MSWTCKKCGAEGGPGSRVQPHGCQGVHPLAVLVAEAERHGVRVVYDLSPLPARAPDSLDAAWAEAEALIGKDSLVLETNLTDRGAFDRYGATVLRFPSDEERAIAFGPTPAAALLALAARLREGK